MQPMSGVVRPYAWGSTTTIPQLLGKEPTGEPQAELWLGAHPAGASTLNGQPLNVYVAREPERYLGAASLARFGPRLPYLMKVLAAARPLSLQAHPSRAQAEAGYAREQAEGVPEDQQVYADDWPKPEVLCALETFEALCGFRDPRATYALLQQLGAPGLLELVAPLRNDGAAGLAEVFSRLLRLPDPGAVLEEVLRHAAPIAAGDGPELELLARTAGDLAEEFPGDPGVLAALLLNRVELRPTEALFLPAGNLHSYLRGSGIEIMANSDNVLRGGLTSKQVAVEELLAVLDFTPAEPARLARVEEAAGVWRYRAPAPEFTLWRLEISGSVQLPGEGSGRTLLVIDGSLRATAPGVPGLDLTRGQAAFFVADDTATLTGDGTAFLAGGGI